MNPLVNPVTVRPDELKGGVVMAAVVTCHITGKAGCARYRLYRCPFPPGASMYEGIPQRARIADEGIVAGQLFPVVNWAGASPG